ncbi:Protein BCCIP-like [Apostasia shenzhenica]|uniref:Protein BCCIP-like n=1 Tax=Apostasia shenzhenica TaxID=1088818 RepID=A0A2I0ATD2_9ASPA|nr:Protein BCCIP-like [Apostasia shenzhenica]
MVHRRRPSKRRILPILSTFSAFSRTLSLARSASAVRRKVFKPCIRSRVPEKENRVIERRHNAKSVEFVSCTSDYDNKEENQQEEKETIVQADFGFFDPKPGDFHGVKLLLQNYLDDKPWDLGGFVDLILQQTTVGTVVKLDGRDEGDEEHGEGDDEEDLYAIISALNFGRYFDHRCIGEFRQFLLGVCTDENTKRKLRVLLEEQASNVGLLVSQRFVNCPHQLVPHLYDALFDEISWAIEDEPTQELRDSFRFKFYLLISTIYEKKCANQQKAKSQYDSDEPIIYIKAEDEVLHEMSSFSFTFPIHDSKFVPHELKNYRTMGLVMIVNADFIPEFREKLKLLLSDD